MGEHFCAGDKSSSTSSFILAAPLPFTLQINCLILALNGMLKKSCGRQVPLPILFGAKLSCAGVVIVVAANSSRNVGLVDLVRTQKWGGCQIYTYNNFTRDCI